MIANCPLCDSADLLIFFQREKVPLSANVLYPTREAALTAPAGRISLSACRACGFVFNAAFDVDAPIYGAAYDNDQTFSPHFVAHMQAVGAAVRRAAAFRQMRVLEVGCGQGGFLDMLMSQRRGDVAVGFDPSVRRSSTAQATFIAEYFRGDSVAKLHFDPNIVVSRHVIEHVPQPLVFLGDIRAALRQDAALFLETPCIDHILRVGAFWDICYEHCSYFSERTLGYACRRAGFAVDAVEHVFAGQYLWLEGRTAAPQSLPSAAPSLDLCERFRARLSALQSRWREQIGHAAGQGRVAVWGGGTKGASFVQLIDPKASLIHGVIDINPRKHGQYLAGTGHRIVGWQEAVADGVTAAVVMNPNYLGEIEATIAAAGVSLDLIPAETEATAAAMP